MRDKKTQKTTNKVSSSKASKPSQARKKKTLPQKAEEDIKRLKKKQGYMPFTEHLEELRFRIIRSGLGIAVMSIICFFFYEQIWYYVMSPLANLVEVASERNIVIEIVTAKLQDDFLIQFKIALMVGVLLGVPYVFFEFWKFMIPALDTSLHKWGNYILIFAVLLFWSGVIFARIFIWPLVNEFFLLEWVLPNIPLETGDSISVKKFLNIPDYLSFFLSFHFAFGAAFELPIVCILLALLGILKTSFFMDSWRMAVVAIAVVSAMLTPADWVSMIALMLPLIFLFFISGILVFFLERVKKLKKLQ